MRILTISSLLLQLLLLRTPQQPEYPLPVPDDVLLEHGGGEVGLHALGARRGGRRGARTGVYGNKCCMMFFFRGRENFIYRR